jgi:preprotein translocase subunit SecA
MIETVINKIFGDPNEKKIKEYRLVVEEIKKSEKEFENFNLEQVQAKTAEFKEAFE